MKKQETAEDFYRDRGLPKETGSLFNVFENELYCSDPHVYNRRDYYKISLLLGTGRLSWHDREIMLDRPALVFFNPLIPFGWSPVSREQPGYFCLFKKEFLKENSRSESLRRSPLYRTGGTSVFFPDEAQLPHLCSLFRNMLAEIGSDYVYKYDLLRNYLQLLIHEALKMEPDTIGPERKSASQRLTLSFLELLERQFPIDAPERMLLLRTPGDYAQALSVHVNHLNHAVKEVTGQPTSTHIADRILAEAKALLRHTDWPVSEIAYSLGFGYANYFNNFFKKKTGHPPKHIRAGIL